MEDTVFLNKLHGITAERKSPGNVEKEVNEETGNWRGGPLKDE
jgi:hypothetical protein